MDKYYVEVGDYAELKDGSKYLVDYFGKMKLKDGKYQYYIILCDSKNVFKLNRKPSEFIYSYDLKDDFNKIGNYDFTKERERKTLNIINELDEIVMKCRTKVKEKDLFLQRTQYDKYDYIYEGYRLAMNDTIDLVRELNKKVKSQTPPCTGSSVQKNDTEKLYEFCETLKNFNKAVNDKNKKLHDWITYDINIGDFAELKDGTIGKINYAGRLHKHDEYEWYFVIAIEKGKTLCLYSYDLSKDFQQIGKYNFYSEYKESKIDKLHPTITKELVPASKVELKTNGDVIFTSDSMETIFKKTPPTNEQLIDKINEIIDMINGER